eukprot:CAMPEP_0181139710 /NCGR_PEP_ID=MMETSP1071-20121207/34927_1 /TAXON_ID=35127 /ORGANISM="Thalassiosira sp., Strain NH16" /LENGTH=544 /DNA_ID=CAMNT_0023226635 /DNA_START=49 /DNA_END=1686 /DNA_ORIENTATION=+
MPILESEDSPLLGLKFVGQGVQKRASSSKKSAPNMNEGRKNAVWALFLSAACFMAVSVLQTPASRTALRAEYEGFERAVGSNYEKNILPSLGSRGSRSKPHAPSPYSKVQTLSFQIYTGGAPAFTVDESTGEEKQNHECYGLHSYGLPENSNILQCYLGLEDTAKDVHRRLNIMRDAVDKAYDNSDKDDSVLKIFLSPEFFFRGLNGAFEFELEEAEDENGECSDICHILKGLENIVAHKRFENWMFLFGTVIASEGLPTEDEFDYQFYNFAPLYKGFDPATSTRVGKNFIVPKRYVSNADFLTPIRHLTNRTLVMELLDEEDDHALQDRTLKNPHADGQHKYNNDMWARYKSELTALEYNMIEYGWFYLDGISFSVEICLDHLIHRALMTYMADVVTGSETRVPSSNDGEVEWVGMPRRQAQVSLVSSAGMDVEVTSLALADGGHIFLQDGMGGDVEAHSTFGEDQCKPNEYEFFGGSQSVKRTAVISATDVTFEYEMNMDFNEYNLYPETGSRSWKKMLKGVFSSTAYRPKLTVYDPVDIAI